MGCIRPGLAPKICLITEFNICVKYSGQGALQPGVDARATGNEAPGTNEDEGVAREILSGWFLLPQNTQGAL